MPYDVAQVVPRLCQGVSGTRAASEQVPPSTPKRAAGEPCADEEAPRNPAQLARYRAKREVELPRGGRILFTVEGQPFDHLGSGLCGLGDVDGDGVPDVAVGATRGVPLILQETGYVLVVSGRTGATLYRVDGVESRFGDAFGQRIRSLPDVDEDGTSDVLIDGSSSVAVVSGRNGEVLRREPVGFDDPFDSLAGHLDPSWQQSVSVVELLGGTQGDEVLYAHAPAGDVDQDGVDDVAGVFCERGRPGGRFPAREASFALRLVSGRDGYVLREACLLLDDFGALNDLVALHDLDGDGVPELGVALVHEGRERKAEVIVRSGRDGCTLYTIDAARASFGRSLTSMDDIDGDGRPELVVGDREHEAGGRCAGRAYVISAPAAGRAVRRGHARSCKRSMSASTAASIVANVPS